MIRHQKKKLVRAVAISSLVFGIGLLGGTLCACSQKEAQESVYIEENEPVVSEGVAEEEEKAEPEMTQKQEEPTKVEETESDSVAAPEELEPEQEDVLGTESLSEDWKLILVNRTHPLPEGYQPELKEIADGHKMDVRIYEEFRAMIKAAKAEGIYLYVTSAYRSLDKQTELYEKKTETYVQQGYSYEIAKEKAAEIVAVPGTSEHHLGLALDFVSPEHKKLDENQENTRSFQWMKAHCAEYGFILRYPSDKTEITGIIYEPWHFRYVGKEAAKAIMDAGITLEEYLGAV